MDIIKRLEDAIASNNITAELLAEAARAIVLYPDQAAEIRRLKDQALEVYFTQANQE